MSKKRIKDKDIRYKVRETAFIEILKLIARQEDSIHSWAKFLISIQTALFGSVFYIVSQKNALTLYDLLLAKNENEQAKYLYIICSVGIVTVWFFYFLIAKELEFQGLHINTLNELKEFPPILNYEKINGKCKRNKDLDIKKKGFQKKSFLFLAIILTILWGVFFYFSL